MSPAKWPLRSRGLAVHPSQIPEMQRLFPRHKFDPKTGHMIIESQQEFDQVRADLGFHDNDGYGLKRVSREGYRNAVARLQEEREKRQEHVRRYAETKEGQRRLAELRARQMEAVERFMERLRKHNA